MKSRTRNSTITLIMIAWVLVPAGMGGCVRHGSGTAGTSSDPPSLSAPSPARSPDLATTGRNALDAYRGMWRAYQQAVQVPDPSNPELARYATGPALSTLTTGVRSLKNRGLKGSGDVQVNPKITAASPKDAPTEIEISDCMDSSRSRIVRVSPGSPYPDSPGGHRLVTATVKRQPDGVWKVSSFAAQRVGSC